VPGLRKALRAGETVLPVPSHARNPTAAQRRWVSVEEALEGVPPLDARDPVLARSSIPFHTVPVLDEEKYLWVSSTPPGKGAFDNQCINPSCGFQGNPVHGASHTEDGINRAHADTPIRCLKCGALLPRPWVRNGDSHRLMSGFTSAYKRMSATLPASALTRNLSYACSDQKVHPTQNRVLSLHEAFRLHTLTDFAFEWERADGKRVSAKSIREMIGESIPPRGLKVIFDHLLGTLAGTRTA
jgi:DNA (cytosine-5)-methyltransferase 1